MISIKLATPMIAWQMIWRLRLLTSTISQRSSSSPPRIGRKLSSPKSAEMESSTVSERKSDPKTASLLDLTRILSA